jgi:hypothetical protein
MTSKKGRLPGLSRTRDRFIQEAINNGATYREAKRLVEPGLAEYERRVRDGREPPPKKRD